MRKRLFKLLLCMLLACVSALCFVACSNCGNKTPMTYSQGLTYELDTSTDTYIVTGIGTCQDKNVVIPNKYKGKFVTSIGDYAFIDCLLMTSIEIPNSVTSIGYQAFSGCYRLVEVYNKSTLNITAGTEGNGCVGLYALEVYDTYSKESESKLSTDNNGYVIYTNKNDKILVGYNGNKTDLTLPNGITAINNYAFIHCSSLTSIEIPNSVTSIGNAAFFHCESLTSIEIPNSVTSIGDDAFFHCESLTSIEIPNTVTSIGYSAFSGCRSLTSIEIPNTVTSIGYSAFSECRSLTSIEIPSSVTSIGDSAFFECRSLTSVTIGNGVTNIDVMAFYRCDLLTRIDYAGTIDQWAQIEFKNAYSNPLCYAKNLYINGELVIEAEITIATKISDYAFYNCNSLTSITIGESVISIGNGAFHWCESLTSIEIPNSVTSIGNEAFSVCESLTSIEIPNKVTSIGDRAFNSCDSLTSITIGDSVKSIGEYAFYHCDSLTSIEIPNTVTSIGDFSFLFCSSLTRVDYTGTIDQWAQIEFKDSASNPLCYAKNLYINGELVIEAEITTATKISNYAFYHCNSLTSITIGESVKSIGNGAFRCCVSLTSITIGENVKSIGEYAFSDCTSLKTINFNGTMNKWNVIEKRLWWNYNVLATKVICSDGEVYFENN